MIGKSKIEVLLFIFSLIISGKYSNAQGGRDYALLGNDVAEYIPNKSGSKYFTDPIDDTIHFVRIDDRIYKTKSGRAYLRTSILRELNADTIVTYEYFKDVANFIDLRSYKRLDNRFFDNRGKVQYWSANSDGDFPVEVKDADVYTFIPFEGVSGGRDDLHVFYISEQGDLKIIPGLNPKKVRALNPERGCWNCGTCYFTDGHSVYFGFNKIEGADPKSFKLVNKENVDAVDKNGSYFDGKRISSKHK